MKLTMLGTGNAAVTACYNTCFILRENGGYFLVDGGGGNTILKQLKEAGVNWKDVRDIFVTHKHVDHLMGIIWLVRMICQNMSRGNYEGEANIYGHSEVIDLLDKMARMLFAEKETAFIGQRLHLIPVEDGQDLTFLGRKTTFFDIHSTKARQFGFTMHLENSGRLTCCGDEPYNELNQAYVLGSKWLMHEAFCLFSQADKFKPYEKHHSTVKEACQLAQQSGVENLILYHTEDSNLACRKQLYAAEGATYFSGNLFIPDDLETLEL